MVDVRESAAQAVEVAQLHRVAFVFGNETSGLSNDEVSRCGLLASIPVAPDFSSLNVAAAVQVFCYELRMACGAALPLPKDEQLASHEEVEAFYGHLEKHDDPDRIPQSGTPAQADAAAAPAVRPLTAAGGGGQYPPRHSQQPDHPQKAGLNVGLLTSCL